MEERKQGVGYKEEEEEESTRATSSLLDQHRVGTGALVLMPLYSPATPPPPLGHEIASHCDRLLASEHASCSHPTVTFFALSYLALTTFNAFDSSGTNDCMPAVEYLHCETTNFVTKRHTSIRHPMVSLISAPVIHAETSFFFAAMLLSCSPVTCNPTGMDWKSMDERKVNELVVITCMEGGGPVDDKADEDEDEEEEEEEVLAALMVLAHKNRLHLNDVPYGHKTPIMLRLPLRSLPSGWWQASRVDASPHGAYLCNEVKSVMCWVRLGEEALDTGIDGHSTYSNGTILLSTTGEGLEDAAPVLPSTVAPFIVHMRLPKWPA
ncbi:unnamed protein product [Hydatigera taeniaeformis]|uniref:Calpain_III domain-containing protein n=1 Tax=Hydatigena taeniaeformis TaxID=6205 RepID=A0A0R3XBN5_HYDTA|nr:unnamed protein product [Hydatigera taeniaeformis]